MVKTQPSIRCGQDKFTWILMRMREDGENVDEMTVVLEGTKGKSESDEGDDDVDEEDSKE